MPIFVPKEYVDGVHTREVMDTKEFPLKIKVHSTGHILYVNGFTPNGMIYHSIFSEDGATYFSSEGTYCGKLGKDFNFI